MGPEVWTIISCAVALGALLAAFVVIPLRGLQGDVRDLQTGMGDLRERLARLKGMFAGMSDRIGGLENP